MHNANAAAGHKNLRQVFPVGRKEGRKEGR